MRSLISLVVNFTLFIRAISAQKYVFAHVVVGDTAAHTQATWASDIALAQAAAIDAFMLNIAYGDSNVPIQVGNAFAAAEAASFKLAFSFDYLGGTGAWPASGSDSVVSYLNQYVSSSAYLFYSSAAFVSTFEGTSNIGDWAQGGTIRSAVSSSIYFVPDYTSLGPSGISPYLNDIEGAFSWDIWPEGATNMTDAPDVQWVDALSPSGKTYMMGVSPWFFHSASGGTDWVWRGDDMVSNQRLSELTGTNCISSGQIDGSKHSKLTHSLLSMCILLNDIQIVNKTLGLSLGTIMGNHIISALSMILQRYLLALPSMIQITHMIPGVIFFRITSQLTRAILLILPMIRCSIGIIPRLLLVDQHVASLATTLLINQKLVQTQSSRTLSSLVLFSHQLPP